MDRTGAVLRERRALDPRRGGCYETGKVVGLAGVFDATRLRSTAGVKIYVTPRGLRGEVLSQIIEGGKLKDRFRGFLREETVSDKLDPDLRGGIYGKRIRVIIEKV